MNVLCVCLYIYIYIHTYPPLGMGSLSIYIYIGIHLYLSISVSIYLSTCVNILCVCFIYIHTHTYVHIQRVTNEKELKASAVLPVCCSMLQCAAVYQQNTLKASAVLPVRRQAGGPSSAANTTCVSIYSTLLFSTPRAMWHEVEMCQYLSSEGRGCIVCSKHHVC